MSSTKAASRDCTAEISALIATLNTTERRLEELTGGEIDTVTDREGRTFLLRHAQEELRHSEETRQADILNSLPAHIALLDARGVILSVNQAWRQFAEANGLGPPYAVGLNYLDVCDRASKTGASDAGEAAAAIRSVLAGEARSLSVEYPCHSALEPRWFLTTVTPLGDGRPTGAVVMHLNITARKRAEDALRSSLKDKEALLREVHHRVKNNMQVITSLLRLESSRIDHPTTKSVLKDMQNRIMAMAALHEAVYRSNNFAQVDLGAYLRQLTSQLSRSLVAVAGQVSFDLDLLSVGLDLEQAVPCGLIVNELVSNALKHGFRGGRTGEVRIELKRSSPEELQLTVSDDGIGLPADFEALSAKSLGLQLVSDLSRQLGGRLRVGPGPRAVFEVTFPPHPTEAVGQDDASRTMRSLPAQNGLT